MSYDSQAAASPDMTPIRPRHLWLLVLTLVVGQWLAVVHGIQHELNAGEQLVACELCAVGHASAGPPAASVAPSSPPLALECPPAARQACEARPSLRVPPLRGPPSFLV